MNRIAVLIIAWLIGLPFAMVLQRRNARRMVRMPQTDLATFDFVKGCFSVLFTLLWPVLPFTFLFTRFMLFINPPSAVAWASRLDDKDRIETLKDAHRKEAMLYAVGKKHSPDAIAQRDKELAMANALREYMRLRGWLD